MRQEGRLERPERRAPQRLQRLQWQQPRRQQHETRRPRRGKQLQLAQGYEDRPPCHARRLWLGIRWEHWRARAEASGEVGGRR